MIEINRRVLPHFERVVRLVGQDPSRDDFGYADFPTLLSLILLAIPVASGDRQRIVKWVMRVTAYRAEHVEFMLDQYQGKDARHHLWRRTSTGRYRLLV